MAPKLKFSEGEKVLCFHGPLLYEAKCMKSQVKDKQIKYFIHYSGWNKTWDEWVPENRVLKYTDANLQKQKELEEIHTELKNKSTENSKKEFSNENEAMPAHSPEKALKQKGSVAACATPTDSSSDTPRKIRTRSEQNVKAEEENAQKLELKIELSTELKSWLVDDYGFINHKKKLVKLPACFCVDNIIGEYEKERFKEEGITINEQASIKESCKGVREYFNTMLTKQLLYKFERPQRNDLIAQNPEKSMSQIYGASHLLRLFSKLDRVLAYTVLDNEAVALLGNRFQEFLKYFSEQIENFVNPSDYESVPPEYLKRVA